MEAKIVLNELLYSSRARVYLVWAAIVGVGFIATHYYQQPGINGIWLVLSAIGFYCMTRAMPLGVRQMRNIYLAWLIPIGIGMVLSVLAVRTSIFPSLTGYLGPLWLIVMAFGYFWNGLADSRSNWYYVAAVLNIAAAIMIYAIGDLLAVQYLITAVISVWSMLLLWVFYSDL